MFFRLVVVWLIAFVVPASARAGTDVVKLFGNPKSVEIDQSLQVLRGLRANRQLTISATFADGHARDLTHLVDWETTDQKVVTVSETGLATARGNGKAIVFVKLADKFKPPRFEIEIEVKDFDKPQPFSFQHEVIPVMNRAGCNMGACHGTPNGKGGFKLSLRGYDPVFDFDALTRDAGGRRTNPQSPDESLILQKPLTQLSHQGGKRFPADSNEHRILRGWIAEGAAADLKDSPRLTRLLVTPGKRVFQLVDTGGKEKSQQANWQQLSVIAHFADGSVRDVTRLCHFSSSNEELAEVTNLGTVQPSARGEVAILVRYQHLIESARMTFLTDDGDFEWPDPPQFNAIDKHIDAKLKLLQIAPSDVSEDHVFLRRVYLDVIGTLPTAEEARKFLADKDKDKRAKLIDHLLERPEFTAFWTMKWADLLRVNEKYMGNDGVKLLHEWIRGKIAKDEPFDQTVRELLTATGNGKEVAGVHFFRAMPGPESAAETVSQLFMGVRMGCARCHNHPFERWSQEEYFGIAAFFAQVGGLTPSEGKEPKPITLVIDKKKQVKHPKLNQDMPPMFPGGVKPAIPGEDRRQVLADWLTDPKNPFFAKALANRIWFHVMGRGLVEPVDDFRDSNVSANDPLLELLTAELVKGGFRMKPLIRLILNSRAYQTSAKPNKSNKEDALYFSRAHVTLLGAEQLLDAICDATSAPEKLPGDAKRAIELVGVKNEVPFLKAFNRPNRDMPCECEREREPTLTQALLLISGRLVQGKLAGDKNRIVQLLNAKKSDAEIVEELYLASLSRFPTDREAKAALKELKEVKEVKDDADRRAVLEDLAWALINSKEFMYRH